MAVGKDVGINRSRGKGALARVDIDAGIRWWSTADVSVGAALVETRL
jgi:hypothetical protein